MTDIKSEGQRQLLEITGTEDELAAKLGYSRAIIGHWRRGIRLPGVGARYKLDLLCSIPPWTWDVEPGVEVPTEPTPKNTDGEQLREDDDTLDIVRKQLLEVRETLATEGLTDSARLKLLDTSAKLLALRNRLERDRELQEDRIVREHPAWLRIKAAMLKALEPYPEAAAAIAEAIE
jgi:transcriptional regulator with XRE-family HTH domain